MQSHADRSADRPPEQGRSTVPARPPLVLLRGERRPEAGRKVAPPPLGMSSFPPPEGAEEWDATGSEASRVLEQVVAKFRGMLGAAAARHRLDPTERDALTQELRLRLWHALKDAATIGSVSATYVQRATMSAALDLLRRRRDREQALPDDDFSPAPALRSSERADVLLEASDVAQAVERALLVLPESRRAVVRLHLRGYERDEIGTLLGWSEAKTRNLLYRGLEDLRNELTRLGFGPEAK
jgi:RNA polymerase sigma factor (sigma-70 family)